LVKRAGAFCETDRGVGYARKGGIAAWNEAVLARAPPLNIEEQRLTKIAI